MPFSMRESQSAIRAAGDTVAGPDDIVVGLGDIRSDIDIASRGFQSSCNCVIFLDTLLHSLQELANVAKANLLPLYNAIWTQVGLPDGKRRRNDRLPACEGRKAVSYTHLDVYKRQG